MIRTIPDKTIGRLSLYRRVLVALRDCGTRNIYSHQLARAAGVSAAQVRRDVMTVGYHGSPTRGYDVRELIDSIAGILDHPSGQSVALVGVGNLGRAILAFFSGRRPNLAIVAAFDRASDRVNRVIHGCRSYPMEQLAEVIGEQSITVGIVAVPAPAAQDVAGGLVAAGVQGILNFAPTPLRLPPETYVEDVDITTSLEKVAFFARRQHPPVTA